MVLNNKILTPLTEDNLKTIGCCLKGYTLQKQFEANIPRLVENERLRSELIKLRDVNEKVPLDEMIVKIIDLTEKLEP